MKPVTYPINGILLLDKPLTLSSNSALQKAKRLYSAKKAGHTGSLDPLATGMLPLCFGEATKFSQYLLDADKHYEVRAVLGVRTNTADAEGEVIARSEVGVITREALLSVLQQFSGEILQVPPMFSALKLNGQPLYKLARRGIEVEREARKVHIFAIDILELTADSFSLAVHCSKGTYIRTLVDDIGQVLGCGAHVGALRRIKVVPYEGRRMYSLDELQAVLAEQGLMGLQKLLLPMDSALEALPVIELEASSVFYLKTGQAIMAPGGCQPGLVRLYAKSGEFLGLGEIGDDRRVKPIRLRSTG